MNIIYLLGGEVGKGFFETSKDIAFSGEHLKRDKRTETIIDINLFSLCTLDQMESLSFHNQIQIS